jgi:hypothetical protein
VLIMDYIKDDQGSIYRPISNNGCVALLGDGGSLTRMTTNDERPPTCFGFYWFYTHGT